MHNPPPARPARYGVDCQPPGPFYRRYLWAVFSVLALTLLGWPFRAALKPGNLLLVYLLGVFFVAIQFGLWPSILAALSSAAAFAFFFAPPIFSFAIADPENLAGLSVMLVVGAVTSKLAESVRVQAKVAEQRERQATALYRLGQALAEARLESEILRIGARHIHAEFHARNTFLLPGQGGKLRHPEGPPETFSLRGADLALARRVFGNGQTAGKDADAFSGRPAVYVPLNGSTGAIGVLALEAADPRRIFVPEQRQLLASFANQIVHTLERARLAEQAKQATLKMQAETLRNSLLSGISHDLRTPLATIVGAASTLEADGDRLDPDSRKKLAGAIGEEARRMSDLTGKILEMARLDAGEVALNRQWYAPEEFVGSAIRRLDKKLKDRTVNVRMENGLALVHVDAVLLQQVLVNLLDNADKYTPKGRPIDILVEASPQDLLIAVADRGPGIPEDLRDRIFEKFFRVHAESAQSGVGLGLAICRAIVEAHGGDIRAENRGGGGAVFRLRLPAGEAPPGMGLDEEPPDA
jgi:two-component system sensor histidine kinase KdpD